MKKERPALNTAAMIVAALFLFNPNINILDVLPDCVAYLCLIAGMRRLPRYFEPFARARRGFLYLTLLTFTRLPAYVIMMGTSGYDDTLRINLPLFALCYGIVELLLAIPAFHAFFEGLDYLGTRYGVRVAASRGATLGRNATMTLVIARPVLALLPELCYLYNRNLGEVTYGPDILTLRPYLVLLSCLVGLIIGGVFLYRFIPLCRHLGRDETLSALCAEKEAALPPEPLPLHGMARVRRLRTGLYLLCAGVVCMIDLNFDQINYLPDAIGILLLCAGVGVLYPCLRRGAIPVWCCAGAWVGTSIAAYVLERQFFATYSYGALGRLPAADALYDALQWVSLAEGVCAVGTLLCLSRCLSRLIQNETGYPLDHINPYASHRSLHGALQRKNVFFTVLGCLCAVVRVCDVFLRRITEAIKLGKPTTEGVTGPSSSQGIFPVFGWLWLLDWILTLLWILYTWHMTSTLSEEIENKYALD